MKTYICTCLVICTETIMKIKASHLNKGRWTMSSSNTFSYKTLYTFVFLAVYQTTYAMNSDT